MYNTFIFDLDGTLVDSLEDLANSTNMLLEELGYPPCQLDQYRHFVGNGVDKLIERALKQNNAEYKVEYRKRFDEIYSEHCLDHTKPYKGIQLLVNSLAHEGYKLAVVTNKPKKNAVTIVEKLFPNKFMYVFGNTVYQPKKPHPCLTNLAIDLMDSSKGEVLYIGDSDVDIETAKNAKVKSVGCTWGFRGEEELKQAGATYIIKEPKELMRIIKK